MPPTTTTTALLGMMMMALSSSASPMRSLNQFNNIINNNNPSASSNNNPSSSGFFSNFFKLSSNTNNDNHDKQESTAFLTAPDSYRAVAVLTPTQGNTANGIVTVIQSSDYEFIQVQVNMSGVAPNSVHAIHFHTFGDISDPIKAEAIGGHFNPTKKNHSCPGVNGIRRHDTHSGDLGSVTADGNGNIYGIFDSKMVA
ncbi:hypothetical protein HDU76_007005, partial [Blyttiomyces sp. JEL0837]